MIRLRPFALILAFTISGLAGSQNRDSTASQVVQVNRSRSEMLTDLVRSSPLIAIGHTFASYDTTVESPPGMRFRFTVIDFAADEFLRGNVPSKRFRYVRWYAPERMTSSRPVGSRTPTVHPTPNRVIALFEDLGAETPSKVGMAAAARGVSRWAGSTWSEPSTLPRISDWSSGLESEIRAEIAKQKKGN
jgi:hypothetical protein